MTYFYITGLISGISFAGFIGMWIAYRSTKKKLDGKDKTIKAFQEENQKFKEDNDKRIARYKTEGWHKISEKNDKNRYEWNVYFDLKKVSTSEDRKKSKFEVISITSGNTKEAEDCSPGTAYFEFYKDWFLKQTGEGWLSNSLVEWVIDLPKEAMREIKLRDLGIE